MSYYFFSLIVMLDSTSFIFGYLLLPLLATRTSLPDFPWSGHALSVRTGFAHLEFNFFNTNCFTFFYIQYQALLVDKPVILSGQRLLPT